VFKVNRRTGEKQALNRPQVGGWSAAGEAESIRPDRLPESDEDIAALIPVDSEPSAAGDRSGYGLGSRLVREFGGERYPYRQVCAPLWQTYELWGFEGMMELVATRPDLIECACQRILTVTLRTVREAAAQGTAAIWIEDCLTDMIGPQAFAALNVRFVRRLVEEIRAAGMKSIYYFAGNPTGKWDLILSIGADGLSMEESKKNFRIDIEDIVERVRGRCTVLGNLDAIGVLQDGSESELRAEIARQIAAGRKNGGRFIMSLGSPVTPQTPVEKVRLYCDLVHELGR
jgi:uroporphyrinogen-III decarboxylase